MKSKIIKVSIILIFMMLSACLFNFCFATITTDDYEIVDTYEFKDGGVDYTLNFVDFEKEFVEFTPDMIPDNHVAKNFDNFYYLYYINSGVLYCDVSPFNELRILDNRGFMGFSDSAVSVTLCQFVYDFDTATWSSTGSGLSARLAYNTIVSKTNISLYESSMYADTSRSNCLYNPEDYNIPPVEELVNKCDFKVRVSFGDELDIDGYPYDREILSYNALVIHNLTDWEKYFDVNLTIELSNYSSKLTKYFYYDLYNISGERLINNERIKRLTTIDLNANDYFTFHTYNTDDNVKLTYRIYQKNSTNLIMTKVIRFNFNSSYLWQDVTGNILEDNTYDSSGSLISGENNKVESNGTNFTDINNNFDFNSTFVFDLDSLQSTLENNVENSKSFFSLITTFLGLLPIWISSLIYFFLTGVIVITLFRMIRGA